MLGSLISAGASIVGGLLGNKQAKRQEQLQKEFAQSGIQWKVEDAKKAGIHPALALGAQPASYSPVSVGSDLGSGIAAAGQDISRAIDTTRTATSRIGAFDRTVQALTLQKMGLENELLASQVAKVKQQVGPPMAGSDYLIPGQTSSGIDDVRAPQSTSVARLFGKGLYDTGNFSDAQTFEDIGGEGFGDWFGGPLNFIDRIRVGSSNLPQYKAWREYKAKGGTLGVRDFLRRYYP